MGDTEAELPETPTRPSKELGGTNYKKYHWELKLYNTHMETERATIELLKGVFHNGLVGLEVTFGQLPPNLKARKAFDYIETMATEPYIDLDAALALQESAV